MRNFRQNWIRRHDAAIQTLNDSRAPKPDSTYSLTTMQTKTSEAARDQSWCSVFSLFSLLLFSRFFSLFFFVSNPVINDTNFPALSRQYPLSRDELILQLLAKDLVHQRCFLCRTIDFRWKMQKSVHRKLNFLSSSMLAFSRIETQYRSSALFVCFSIFNQCYRTK